MINHPFACAIHHNLVHIGQDRMLLTAPIQCLLGLRRSGDTPACHVQIHYQRRQPIAARDPAERPPDRRDAQTSAPDRARVRELRPEAALTLPELSAVNTLWSG